MKSEKELTKINEYGLGICPECGKYTYLNQMPGKYYGLCYDCFVAETTRRKGVFVGTVCGSKIKEMKK